MTFRSRSVFVQHLCMILAPRPEYLRAACAHRCQMNANTSALYVPDTSCSVPIQSVARNAVRSPLSDRVIPEYTSPLADIPCPALSLQLHDGSSPGQHLSQRIIMLLLFLLQPSKQILQLRILCLPGIPRILLTRSSFPASADLRLRIVPSHLKS